MKKIWLSWLVLGLISSPITVLAKSTIKKSVVKSKYAVVLTDKVNGFVLTTAGACKNVFKVKAGDKVDPASLVSDDVFIVRSRWWPKKVMWTNYEVMTQAAFDAISAKAQPGKPDIILPLAPGNLLVQYYPQDLPRDVSKKCVLSAELWSAAAKK